MNPILNKNLFFVKEQVGMFKAANNYDIYDPADNSLMMVCREENLGFFSKIFRFTDYKRMTPFDIQIKTSDDAKVLRIKRGVSFWMSQVDVFDDNEILIGSFKQKFFSIGGKFDVRDANENVLCSLKGKWTSWDFRFIKGEEEFAHVTKKWAGLGKEFFTSADNYMLQISEKVPEDNQMRILIMAAVMCIDMVLKE